MAITARGLKEEEMKPIVDLIDEAFINYENQEILEAVAVKVNKMMNHKSLFVA